METVSRIVNIMKKPDTSTFLKMNAEAFFDNPYSIGATRRAVNDIIARGDELRYLMPRILALDPNSVHSNWDERVADYFRSINRKVTDAGLKLEIGWKYDVNSITHKEAIAKLKTKYKFEDDEDFAEVVEKHIPDATYLKPESERYKYATPINEEDYVFWRYCLSHSEIAKRQIDIDKSPRIRFYMFTDDEVNAAKKDMFEMNRKAVEYFLEAIKSEDSVNNILIVLTGKTDFLKLDAIDKHMKLDEQVKANPIEFIKVATDKNLANKALIEKYVNAGFIKRLPGSSIIVDTSDPSLILGNTLDEAITFISNPANKAQVSEYEAKYKGLSKTK